MPVALTGGMLHNPGIFHITVDTIPVRTYHLDSEMHNLSVRQDLGFLEAVVGLYPRPPGFFEITPQAANHFRVHLSGTRQLIVSINEMDHYAFDYNGSTPDKRKYRYMGADTVDLGGREGYHAQYLHVDFVQPSIPPEEDVHDTARNLQNDGGTDFLLTFYLAISGGEYIDPNATPAKRSWMDRFAPARAFQKVFGGFKQSRPKTD
ncbi:hypothetical protein FN846DRAFT_998041 [Sphaerosporella brunnea]|uniref:Uncharacterized protein n=1 Tax=Sphaerosporella brunnea TaxID=1250544 RepID=A0A5J5F6A8_9PEZI|nr:hypothetical protein FN846DRAFT_998041 [Sphaerosporella brunnea]